MTTFKYQVQFSLQDMATVFGHVNLRLSDYPGRKAYDCLAIDLESALREGRHVFLYDLPGFLLLSGFVNGPSAQRWHRLQDGTWHKSAADALTYTH